MPTSNKFGSVEPTFVAKVPGYTSPKFSFVTITNPGDLTDKEKKRKIRQHAKRQFDRSKARTYRARFENEGAHAKSVQRTPAVVPLSNASPEPITVDQTGAQDRRLELIPSVPVARSVLTTAPLIPMSYLRPLGAGRGYEPFKAYPVPATPRMIQLLDFMVQHRSLYQRPMASIWLSIGMADKDCFYITLAQASNSLSRFQGNPYPETPESIRFYSKAVKALNKRISCDADRTSDGVVGTILGLAYLDMTYNKWERWRVHMNGLKRVLELRGGANTLQSSYELQMTTFWNDISGSLTLDSTPWFPLPGFAAARKQPSYDHRLRKFEPEFKDGTSLADGLRRAIYDLADVADYVEGNGLSSDESQRELFVAQQLNPVIHGLLSLPRVSPENAINEGCTHLRDAEMLRLSALLLCGFIRRHAQSGLPAIVENRCRLRNLLHDTAGSSGLHLTLRLWILTMSALADPYDRADDVAQLALTMELLQLRSWSAALALLRSFIWISEMLDEMVHVLGDEVATYRAMYATGIRLRFGVLQFKWPFFFACRKLMRGF
ncbi:uncharacterized protein PV09_04756 [Verruconis gallopava]|uniref:Transcription factor domain-containing protein n=1 Tax=Verruconis gallopava TaxID=253628 RepID=A0A0D2AAW0_9PEZI|nr:uncharacterized protein PV09_04756 [Verruconis gallopava]KIW03913.1 hypothetical protein PV09_04756 [Verruconis gallopava]